MGKTRPIDPSITRFFSDPVSPLHRQYLALRSFYLEERSAEEVASEFGYSVHAVYSMAKAFKKKLEGSTQKGAELFFKDQVLGRPSKERDGDLVELVVSYRKKQLSVPDIKVILDARGYDLSEGMIYRISDENGFARLPKRSHAQRLELMGSSGYTDVLPAPVTVMCPFDKEERFSSDGVGVLCFLPFIKAYGIDRAIEESSYPGTAQIDRLNSILAFLALKLSDVKRYGHDDGWCMDRGLGMFAGLNVLPKTSWYSTYSSAVERLDNVAFLRSMGGILADKGLVCDTANLDFTAIPYWGDEDPFENNWSGKRSKALASIQAVLAQDPDSGILCYGDTTVKHDGQSDVILEFMDFYHGSTGKKVSYLVFDSKFTTLENLGRINGQGIYFITIQRRSKGLSEMVAEVPDTLWKKATVEKANHKSRTVQYFESTTTNRLYGDQELRQISIKGRSIRPTTIMTNDFTLKAEDVIRRYSRRWLIEGDISEQIHFFHLNRNCSGIVVKVDFDLTMSILAHNLYRILARELPGFTHNTATTLYEKFIKNSGDIIVEDDCITVKMNRKRHLPLLREGLPDLEETYSWIGGKKIVFTANSHT